MVHMDKLETTVNTEQSTAGLTDFYEISMAQAALDAGMADKRTTFELFARRLPEGRRYGVVSGVNRALKAVENFRFTEEQLSFLEAQPVIHQGMIQRLREFKFEGNISAYPDGSLYFPYSPILTIEGTFFECVLLETVLLSILNHDSAIASAASRMVQATHGLFPLIEMGSRRTHEYSAVAASQAAYIAGFAATSNIEAGMLYGIPVTGTAAHAFTLSFGDEKDAFRAQVNTLGVSTTLLVDTYNIEQGIRNAIEVAGPNLGAIRIDSGDLHEETVAARKLLDSLGAVNTRIILSSDIDEYTIATMVERGTPVDGAGAGTRVVTGSGHPTAGMVYKLVEREADNGEMVPVAKKASGKKSIGGRKHAYRYISNETGLYAGEVFSSSPFGEGIPRLDGHSILPVQKPSSELLEYELTDARETHRLEMLRLPSEAKFTIAGDSFLTAVPA